MNALIEQHGPADDFPRSLIALQDTPPAPLGRGVLQICLLFIALLIGWAAVARLDIVAVADGKLVPATYLKIVQPAEQGVVKEILVAEGQAVKAGDTLIRMDSAVSAADVKALEATWQDRRLALRRIDAQLNDEPFARMAGDPPELYNQVAAQYQANRTAFDNAIAEQKSLLDKARYDHDAAVEVRNKLLEVLPHYREQEQAYEKLIQKGYAAHIDYTDKQRERIEKERDLKTQEFIIRSAEAAIADATQRMEQIRADYRKQLQAERVDTASKFEQAEQELAKQRHRHEYLELKAPQDGVVKDLATHTVGTVTSPGTVLMTLVPEHETLRAEVWVRNDDVGFVRPGQSARLKFAAFTFQKYGMLDGEVSQVSADASERGEAADGPQRKSTGGVSDSVRPLAYRALLDLKSQTLVADGVSYSLRPGMQVAAEIKLGTRTVLEYLLSPVTQAFHEAARER